jgi:flagellar M-ring protein FliF
MEFKLFIEQFKKFINSMTKQQKLVLFSSIGVLFAAVIFVFMISSKVEYAPLFSNLSPQDASSVVEYLEQKKIEYKLINGTTIEVPKDRVYRLRLDLVAKGLPKHGVIGFEIFDKQSFGTTNFVENINYIRSLEGELTRTIESIAEVKSAKVNLAIPKPTIFTEEEMPPKASIVVDLHTPLSKRQVSAIQKLVAASIPKLSYKNVTIVDSDGNLLTRDEDDEELLTANEIKYKKLIEQEYKRRIAELLTPILGKNKFVSTIDIVLDLSKVKTKSISYDPKSVVVSEQNEESSASTPINGGVPGVMSNVDNNSTQTKNQSSKNEKSKTITNYDVGRTETVTDQQRIKIKRISVAVITDGIYEPVKNKKGKIVDYKYKPQDAQTIKQIQDAVMKAIGYDAKRGDQISVSSMAFSANSKIKKTGGIMNSGNIVLSFASYYKYAIMALLLLIFYFLFLRKFIKNVTSVSIPEEEEKEALSQAEEEVMSEEAVKGKSVKEIEQEIANKLDEEENIDEEAIKNKVMREKIIDIANENPEEIANIIKAVMSSKQ